MSTSDSPFTRPLILLAEDEALIAMDISDSLKSAGYEVAGPFATCADAETWLATGTPDGAILDNQLKDGPCDQLARDLGKRGVPIVMFSGQEERRASSADWKATWVTKPAAFPILLDILQRETGLENRKRSGLEGLNPHG